MYYGIFLGVPMLNVIREHIHHSEKKHNQIAIHYHTWLVISNRFIFHNICDNPSYDFHIFQDG